MNSPLLGKYIHVQKPVTVVIRNDEWHTYLALLPGVETLYVKSVDCLNPTMLVAYWDARKLLVIERDLRDANALSFEEPDDDMTILLANASSA